MDKSKQKFVLRYFQQVVVISDVAVAASDQKNSERPNPYLRNWNDQPKCIKKGRIRPNYKTDPWYITKIVVVYLLFFQSILTATFFNSLPTPPPPLHSGFSKRFCQVDKVMILSHT